MKKVFAILAIAGFVACNSGETKAPAADSTKKDSTATAVDTTKKDSSKAVVDTTKKDTTKKK
ncbi:MAG: hypothetical protein C0459_03090 [Chitinophaga sp.]|jgi:hypothetical protein|nr:hypothetical protein [Chitinophaga sp.]